jgi:hypothetical protein
MSIMEIEKDLKVCNIRNHPYLDCEYKEDKIEKKEICSKCGGEHMDLTCIYFRNNVNKSCKITKPY